MHYLLMIEKGFYPLISLKNRIDNLSWVDGKKFDADFPLLEFVVKKHKEFTWGDFVRPAPNIPLFSKRFKKYLDQSGVTNIDFYQATITYEKTGETRTYHAGNIIGLVAAIDKANSVFTPFDEHGDIIREIDKLVLDETALEGIKICRLAENDLLIVIDDTVKELINNHDLTGARVVAQHDYHGSFL